MQTDTCCFIGHRTLNITPELRKRLSYIIEDLILEMQIDTFLFGSKSQFIELCYEIVSELKNKYPQINRIYIRAEFPYISDDYKKYLLQLYEDTYFPKTALGAGKAVYIKRNFEMINKSLFCIFFYDLNLKGRTKIAYDYATKKEKNIINLN